ncbi:hypothetical protein IWQ60_012307 [Tieghemiomyces parasiticus]|uniref:Cytokinin riboside 5'-monophosphate phosphoribohydrolase n=1 Tax=Tieghemiomyces parasiticus TaxID=78921 RepID=A0A9W7ZNX4_9FUNG|nr:hypothetical protein IWQ60_012307 [Tieghemiomyces parasiticus]
MLDTNPRSRICVFCASSHGSHPEYAEQARELGQALATRGYGLVYGGGTLGLMGEVARAADEHGGDVLGIIPQALIPAEAQGNVIGKVIEVQDMHERKRAMNAKVRCGHHGAVGPNGPPPLPAVSHPSRKDREAATDHYHLPPPTAPLPPSKKHQADAFFILPGGYGTMEELLEMTTW